MKTSSPVRRGDWGKVPSRQLAPFPPYLNSSLIRIGEIFRPAIRANAAAILVAHNHPSGTPDPSPEDVAITRAIVEAGRLLDVECLDRAP
jgi:DNA repair protein RadC